MSAVDPQAGAGLSCARCGTTVVPEQDWCLECGHALHRRVVASGSARRRSPAWPLLAAAAVGAVLALVIASLLGGSNAPSGEAASTQPAATQAATPSATTPAATPPPGAPASSTSPESAPTGAPLWPEDLEAYTIVLMSSSNPSDAAARARALARGGADSGVLLSDGYENFRPGQWVVWRGRYQDRDKAEEALRLIERAGRDGYITFVRRRS